MNDISFRLRPIHVIIMLTATVHLAVNAAGHYGYFRDELYYVACTRHLDWGYVDHPPVSILILALNRLLLGDSLFALRFLPAAAHGLLVWLTARLSRDLSGSNTAETLAGIATAATPLFLAVNGFYSLNAWDMLFSTGSVLLLLRALRTDTPGAWIAFGLCAGIGVQNKYSVFFVCAALCLGLLFSPARNRLLSRRLWIAAGLAAAISVPHLLWQIRYGFPTLEFMNNARLLKNAPTTPLEFFSGLLMTFGPFNALLWVPGLFVLLFTRRFRFERYLGAGFVILMLFFMAMRGKTYYMGCAVPMLYAAGAVAVERWGSVRTWVRTALPVLLVVAGIVAAPLAIPILPVETFIRYQRLLGMSPSREERGPVGVLPQVFADQYGWKEKVEAVARAYRSLSPAEQADCGVFGDNYGRAAALDFFGPPLGLPPAVCRHNSYWMWGPGSASTVIILGGRREDHLRAFEEVEATEEVTCKYSMPYEDHLTVFICRRLRVPLKDLWPELRLFI